MGGVGEGGLVGSVGEMRLVCGVEDRRLALNMGICWVVCKGVSFGRRESSCCG